MKRFFNLFKKKPLVVKKQSIVITQAAMSAWQCGGEDC